MQEKLENSFLQKLVYKSKKKPTFHVLISTVGIDKENIVLKLFFLKIWKL